jgi:hypothetical protein
LTSHLNPSILSSFLSVFSDPSSTHYSSSDDADPINTTFKTRLFHAHENYKESITTQERDVVIHYIIRGTSHARVFLFIYKYQYIALYCVYLNIANNHINLAMAIADDIVFMRHVAGWGKYK